MITPVTRTRFAAGCEALLNGQYGGFMPLRFEVGLQRFPLTRFIATIGLFGIGSDDIPF